MSLSLQMKQAVDKQEKDEHARVHAVRRGLALRFFEADEDLAILFAERVGKDVRDVCLIAQLYVQITRFLGADEYERDIPAREDLLGDAGIWKTRH